MLLLSLILLQAGSSGAAESVPPACADCVTWQATTGQAAALLSTPGTLDGLDVVIRAEAGDPDPAGLLTRLAARGARAGLMVSVGEGIPPATRTATRVVIDAAHEVGTDPDWLAFHVKSLATQIRSLNATAELGLEADPDTWEALDKRGVGAYVDVRVVSKRAPDDGGRTMLAARQLEQLLPAGRESPAFLRFAAGIDVVGERALRVEEVVARHQAAAARQREAVARLVSSGSLVVTFQVPGLAAPMTLTSDVVIYEGDGAREVEQRSLRLNGVGHAVDQGVPRLPILEPERVSAPPLALSLDESYRYRLEGREMAEGRDCYVVAYEPASGQGSLLRGRAWIEARGFALVRAEAVQTGLRGPFALSEQRDVFAPVAVGDTVAWLLKRSEVHQVYEGAGHRTPIDRVLTLPRHEPNAADFAARRAAAHASTSVMLRDTSRGYVYLTRAPAARTEEPRQTAGKATRIRAVAAGALIDPGISRPLPFAGVSYVDFDFLGTGAQVDGFFGGVFGRLAWAVPSLGGSRWRAEGTAFAVLVSYNDRAFRAGVERYDENLRQRPARASIGVARPIAARSSVRVSYELDYTRLSAGDTTAPEFVVPESPLVHGARLGLETRRAGWTLGTWWSAARRQGWHAWGLGGRESGGAGFQRFGARAGRAFVLSPRSVARLDAAWMGGRGLDRFSRYAFDGFENPLRGYPTATVRYDRGAVAHAVLTWNARPGVRLDGFLDAARVRDPGVGPRSRTCLGAGAAVEVPLPRGVLASVEWGYGFQARRAAGEAGAHVVKVMAYRIF